MNCPECGSAMNQHASKVVMASPEIADEGGDLILAVFSCPHCGFNAAQELREEM